MVAPSCSEAALLQRSGAPAREAALLREAAVLAAKRRSCARARSFRYDFPMRIRLLLFALYRDLTGVGEMELDAAPGATAGEVVAALRREDVRFARIPERPVVALNREYSSLDAALADGDELALLPPVAGG